MGLTVLVKEELSQVEVGRASARKAEVSTLLRFAGALHVLPGGRLMVQAEVGLASTARRLQAAIAGLYGHRGEVLRISAGQGASGGRFVVRIVHGSEVLARQVGLLDGRGNPVRGLPPAVVNGSSSDAVAVWRAAFLAQGSLADQGRAPLLEITCPAPEAALSLVGTARRLGIEAKAREARGVDRVFIRGYDTIAALLTRMGAETSLAKWQEQCRTSDSKTARAGTFGTATRIVSFDASNVRRSAHAAQLVCVRVERALEVLGDDVSERLKYAGELRLAHRQASLEELGRLADPPLSKDTIAGRLRRLMVIADKHALASGLPVELADS